MISTTVSRVAAHAGFGAAGAEPAGAGNAPMPASRHTGTAGARRPAGRSTSSPTRTALASTMRATAARKSADAR